MATGHQQIKDSDRVDLHWMVCIIDTLVDIETGNEK